jgi:hypothetical protein
MPVTLLSAVLAAFACVMHPGSGLEVAGDGTIYLADVGSETIWRISPGGDVSPLVTDSWTHELQLDGDGAIVYEREHTGAEQAPQSLRRIDADGNERVLIAPPPDRGRFGSNAFARLADGSIVFAHTVRGKDGQWRAVIRQRDAGDHDGSSVRTIAGALGTGLYTDGPGERATFRMIVNMRPLADGSVLLLDRDRVRRLEFREDGQCIVSTIGPSLIDEDPDDPPFRGGPETTWNRLYGLATDNDGNVLVAYFAGRRVVRVELDGEVTTVHRSDDGWAPIGVAVGPGAVMHVSEISDLGSRLRVLRVQDDVARELAAIPPA